ncbi:hypothetical protein D3C84_749570 [compost metagenome]
MFDSTGFILVITTDVDRFERFQPKQAPYPPTPLLSLIFAIKRFKRGHVFVVEAGAIVSNLETHDWFLGRSAPLRLGSIQSQTGLRHADNLNPNAAIFRIEASFSNRMNRIHDSLEQRHQTVATW